MEKGTSIYLVSEHSLLRSLLGSFLSSKGNMEVIGEAADGETAEREVRDLRPELVLLDIDLPVLSGLKLTERIMEILPDTRIIAVTELPESAWLVDFLRLGGKGYLKNCHSEAGVLAAIQDICDGKFHLEYDGIKRLIDVVCKAGPQSSKIGDSIPPDVLSARERQILHLYARGYKVSEMSSALFLSVSTVSTYIRRIREKLRLERRADLIDYAAKHEIYDDWK